MADEQDNEQDNQYSDLATNEISVAVVAGPEYEMTDRVTAALTELADAIAEAEGDDVAGFNFTPAMSFNDDFAFSNDPAGIKIKLGCVVNGTGCTCKTGGYSSSLRASAFPTI